MRQVKKALSNFQPPDFTEEDGKTALYSAAFTGNVGLAHMLMDFDADPEVAEKEKSMCPLHMAALGGFEDFVEVLTSRGVRCLLVFEYARERCHLIAPQQICATIFSCSLHLRNVNLCVASLSGKSRRSRRRGPHAVNVCCDERTCRSNHDLARCRNQPENN